MNGKGIDVRNNLPSFFLFLNYKIVSIHLKEKWKKLKPEDRVRKLIDYYDSDKLSSELKKLDIRWLKILRATIIPHLKIIPHPKGNKKYKSIYKIIDQIIINKKEGKKLLKIWPSFLYSQVLHQKLLQKLLFYLLSLSPQREN